MHAELIVFHHRRGWPLALAVLAFASALLACAGANGSSADAPAFTLVVAPRLPDQPQVRVKFGEEEAAEVAQDRLSRKSVATRSLLTVPSYTLDVTLSGLRDGRAVERFRAEFEANPAVTGVVKCPCPVPAIPDPTAFGVRKVRRSCATSPAPRATACVEEFDRVQPRPGLGGSRGEPENYHALVFYATAGARGNERVRTLKATLMTGGSSVMYSKSPGSDATLKGPNPTLPLHIGGFEELDKQAKFSAGRLHPDPLARQVYPVSSFPAPGVTLARVEGGVGVAVPVPEKLEKQYKVRVEYED